MSVAIEATEHTPGPWMIKDISHTAHGASTDILAPGSADGIWRMVCTVYTADPTADKFARSFDNDPIGQANSRLIASAPAMFACLEFVKLYLDSPALGPMAAQCVRHVNAVLRSIKP
jgi:hypothetical protein